jgi:hypothetical protein
VAHFDLENLLADLDSDEATNSGLAVRPMTRLELAALVLAFVRLT